MPLLGLHLALVQKHGNALPPGEAARPESERRSVPFFPNFFAMDLAMWLIALNVITILATLFPWDLGQRESAGVDPDRNSPEWYFMSQFQLLKGMGLVVPGLAGEITGMSLFTVVLVFWALIPLFDSESVAASARIATWSGYLIVTGMLALTIWGYAAL